MFLAHSFRLRDPWQCEALDGGAVRWWRVFHRPTGVEHDDALWLVCSLIPPGAFVTLNGQRLTVCAAGVPPVLPSGGDATEGATGDTPVAPAASPRNQFDVTALVAETNRIEIEIPSPLPTAHCPPPTRFPYDVRLGVVGCS